MNRMNDLIRKLSDLRSQYNCFDESEREAYNTLSEAIQTLSAQQWTPCSEGLPKEEDDYLITDYSGGIKTIEVDSFMFYEDGTKDWFYSQNPIAWMPLPEPYKEGTR